MKDEKPILVEFVFKYLHLFLPNLTLHLLVVYKARQISGVLFIYLIQKKKKNLTQWNHILIVVDWREFTSCWTWVVSIPKCFSSRIPALKDVKIFFFIVVILFTCKKVTRARVVNMNQLFLDVLDVMFIVLGFHSLVDYLTSFSGVDLSLMFSEDVPLPLPSWQVDVQIVLFLVDMFAQIELSRNSYFYIHFCTLRVVTCIFFFSITCNIS